MIIAKMERSFGYVWEIRIGSTALFSSVSEDTARRVYEHLSENYSTDAARLRDVKWRKNKIKELMNEYC